MTKIRRKIRVYGIVQGIGFRPFIKRTADRLGIAGDVCNKGSYVEIHAEGGPDGVQAFRVSIEEDAPSVSSIIRVEMETEPVLGETEFRIIESRRETGEIFVSPDLAICPECQKELFDPTNRRYLHPFINCTDCGPRLTILDSMPYDRVRTSMAKFPMCGKCEYEYTHPETRRFDSQPVCCRDDGPQLFIPGREETGDAALTYTRAILRKGGIAAIKGIGGFHLACDAANETAVRRLRDLKRRPQKPFAVMMRDLSVVRRECRMEEGAEKILDGVQKPILILNRKQGGKLADLIAPDNPTVGVMLPYAPVQLLLFSYPDGETMTDMLVMTSGNPSGAPICRTTEDAVKYLSPMCDVILSNDRDIRIRADDSVMQLEAGKPYMIRRSRGYAPLPFVGPRTWKGQVLAVGGELKNTFALAGDELYYPSPYIGDMADLRSVEALKAAVARMERLLEINPKAVACDLHPRYNSTAFAEEYAKENHLPLVYVQHHFAHVLSCMAEHDFEGEAIGISFDGTGYGTDGTIWGGEFMKASAAGFVRLGSLQPFRQAGGDLSSKEGWRIAVSLICQAFAEELSGTENGGNAHPDKSCPAQQETMAIDRLTEDQRKEVRRKVAEEVRFLGLCDEANLKMQFMMLEKKINCTDSTSAGRLFDGVSAILGIRRKNTFEGEASMALEFQADAEVKTKIHPHPLPWNDTGTNLDERSGSAAPASGLGCSDRSFVIPISPMIRQLLADLHEGRDRSKLAGAFHDWLAEAVLLGALQCQKETGIQTVALSGGCFQNLTLLKKCKELLAASDFKVLTHSLVAPNDGGIALGQAWACMNWLNR